MKNQLWIDIWDDRKKQRIKERTIRGCQFISSYQINNNNIINDLSLNLEMYEGSRTSKYGLIVPQKGNEVVRLRISNHQSNKDEWIEHEITGRPNKRYSIVLFNNKSMPIQFKQKIKETEWNTYMVESIPVYEKCFNVEYLTETKDNLLNILKAIYEGKQPITENKQYKTKTNKDMKQSKQTIKLNESQLQQIVKESVKNVLKESKGFEPIKDVIEQLIDITSSGYIPFASPAPSSTEMIVKKNVMQAIDCLKTAYDASCQLYH